jgi:hypothetical protein
LLETQIVELFAHGLRKLRNNFAAFGGKVFARAQQFRIQFLQFTIEPGQFAIALFQAASRRFASSPNAMTSASVAPYLRLSEWRRSSRSSSR